MVNTKVINRKGEYKMVRIMLACSAGMSTSLLVTKMETAAKEAGVEAKIWAVSEAQVNQYLGEFDVLMIGPQVRFKLKSLEKLVNGATPVHLIDMKDYGTMNGKAVFDKAIELYNDFNK